MPQVFSFQETPDSRSESARPPSYTMQYRAVGEQNDYLVQSFALEATPVAIFRPAGKLYRQDIQTEPDGFENYLITVPYTPLQRDVASAHFSFDTTGATVTIKSAKQHVATFDNSGSVAGDWHKGAIGVQGDGQVEGADIVIPALKISYTYKHPQGNVSEAFARSLASVTGRTNANPWRSFPAGELLFIGATGSDGTDAEADVQYQFIGSSNATDLTIGDITNIVKAGHNYAWVEFEDEVQSGEPVRRPRRVHIERVYDTIDFATALGWS